MGKGIGAVTGGLGSLVGGTVGGLTGALGDSMIQSNQFQASQARIDDAASMGQASTAYDQTQQGLAQQQSFVNALNAANGVGNQTGVFNQLQGVANGTGPNPALAALNQATSANVANQAALMAGQRGASQNAGLIARQAALQGGNLQQQAVGQGATMQAQQSLNALNQMGTLASQQVSQQQNALTGYNSAAQNQQANLLNAIEAQNNSRVSMANGMNTTNQATSAQNTKAKNDFTMGLVQGGAAAVSDKNAKKNIKSGDDDVQAFLDSISSKSYDYKDQANGKGHQVGVMAQDLEKTPGGKAMVEETPAGKAVDYGKGFGMMTAALAQMNERLKSMEGGDSKKSKKGNKDPDKGPINAFDGVEVPSRGMPAPATSQYNLNALGGMNSPGNSQYTLGASGQGMMPAAPPQAPVSISLGTDMKMPELSDPVQAFMTGQKVQAPDKNPFQNFMASDDKASAENKGGQAMGNALGQAGKALAGAFESGGTVPGKAKVQGNSLKNDTVPANLSPGEIVLPRSVTQSEDPVKAAAEFVRAIQAKKGLKKKL